MRVLWITNNIIFPDACKYLGINAGTAGGWMYSAALQILKVKPELNLGILAVCSQIEEITEFEIKGVTYFCIPGNFNRRNPLFEKHCLFVKNKFNPDLVHIHGSEYPLGLAFLKACGSKNTVLSIQGLVSVYERYYYGGVGIKDMVFNTTPWDLYTRTGFFLGKKNYHLRGKYEIEYFKRLEHVIGRTDWDRIHSFVLNPKIQYHFCNETLRPVFYGKTWNFERCEKFSIFLSQAKNPSKGVHMVLKALAIVLPYFPKAKIYVGLSVPVYPKCIKERIKRSGYGLFLKGLIKKLKIEGRIQFLGALSAEEMCERYLKSNLFISPGSIENSPNSLGEAQLLGVPCIASNVGGTENIMDFGRCGKIYRFEEYEQLAYYILQVFKKGFIYEEVEYAKKKAIERHDPKKNAKKLMEIYHQILH